MQRLRIPSDVLDADTSTVQGHSVRQSDLHWNQWLTSPSPVCDGLCSAAAAMSSLDLDSPPHTAYQAMSQQDERKEFGGGSNNQMAVAAAGSSGGGGSMQQQAVASSRQPEPSASVVNFHNEDEDEGTTQSR